MIALLLLLHSYSPSAQAETVPAIFPACEIASIAFHKADVEHAGANDKFKHCTLSCRITLDCGWFGAWLVGNLKEFADVFGPGEADLKDLAADMVGIKIGRKRLTKTRGDCDVGCDRVYPRNEPVAQ